MSEPVDVSVYSIAAESQCHRFSHRAMACVWEVWIAGQAGDYAQNAAQAAFDEVDRLEEELSRFVDTGDVARINGLQEGQSVVVGADTFDCLELAAKVHVDTKGAFDVTARSSPTAWSTPGAPGCHSPTGSPDRQSPSMELDRPTRRVTARTGRLHVDLGGIGKGYALDQMIQLLGDWSIEAAIVHSGQSTLYALGGAPHQSHWTVSVRNPYEHLSSLGYVRMRDQALSGSGMTLHGPHIVDPRTGQPAQGTSGAWALATSAALADALSTAFMVMSGAEMDAYFELHPDVAGLRLIRDHGEGDGAGASTQSSRTAPSCRSGTPEPVGHLVRYGAGSAFVNPMG
ncbi:MAG: FAD:protein FMN transferase [Planctomycetes bacterium]|nr:FAD:protein FMN transferase [Planctomycetota bacterium]